jgi:hypothetical protein
MNLEGPDLRFAFVYPILCLRSSCDHCPANLQILWDLTSRELNVGLGTGGGTTRVNDHSNTDVAT